MYFIPIKDTMEFPKALKEFERERNVPVVLILNMSGEKMSGEIKKMFCGINLILKML